MNRFDKMALAAAIIVTLLVARDTMNVAYLYINMLQPSGMMLTIGAAGWVVATYGPIATAAWFWRWTKQRRASWMPHLLFSRLSP